MSLKNKTILGLFLGLGALGWVAGIVMTFHANNLERDNRVISRALTNSIIERSSLAHQLEQLKGPQPADAAGLSDLQATPVSDE